MKREALKGKKNLKIRFLAENITKGLPPKAFRAEAQALLSYVQDNIRYMRDIHGVETLSTPEQTLQRGVGDCDDMVTLLAALLMSAGHPCRFVAIGKQKGNFTHVFLETKVGQFWIGAEPTEFWPLGQVAPGNDWYTLRYNI